MSVRVKQRKKTCPCCGEGIIATGRLLTRSFEETEYFHERRPSGWRRKPCVVRNPVRRYYLLEGRVPR